MLPKEIRKSLFDIRDSIDAIDAALLEVIGPRCDFSAYMKKRFLRRSVERELEIIGEAMNRILKIDTAFEVSNARKIVDLRNRVIHAYDSINDGIIWGIVINHLPPLKAEVQRLLDEQ
ncbi:MAG: DUF86 domain-containing protein [Culturomica sp.]|jgi:uncharacterized protein with HEPN domain|nr:DUF86 domain-containing protein [Culturomica sp.]